MKEQGTARFEKWFGKAGMISIGAVLFLILVGGVVRSTGAGMGCPDWPKCFGQWVPPTSEADLPANYQEIYQDHGYGSTTFNAVKTWTEYVNRLIGVIIGFTVFATALFSLSYFRKNRKITLLSVGALLLTGFQGWIGAKVVDTNLAGWMITIHMLIALVIVMMLIAAVIFHLGMQAESRSFGQVPAWVKGMAVVVLLLTLIQILLGTQVRENVDQVAESLNYGQRDTWISLLGPWFSWHKVFYFSLAAALVVWIRGILTHVKDDARLRRSAFVLIGLVAAEILFGIILSQFSIPAWMQPVHLLFASAIFALESSMLMWVFRLEGNAIVVADRKLKNEYSLNGNS
ncbi:MAG: COX15/CtaA family protein [Bacteroidia bacterium]|nr:COX15/CtaA family protein [Bacteroidia bacterium]